MPFLPDAPQKIAEKIDAGVLPRVVTQRIEEVRRPRATAAGSSTASDCDTTRFRPMDLDPLIAFWQAVTDWWAPVLAVMIAVVMLAVLILASWRKPPSGQ